MISKDDTAGVTDRLPEPLSLPTLPSEVCLVVIWGRDLGRRVELAEGEVEIGRESDCHIQLDQDSVSRHHCSIRRGDKDGTIFTLRDLGSTNGTYLNGRRVTEVRLTDGDLITIGQTRLKFLASGNIEARYHDEIYRLTVTDGLTQTCNRRHFDELLATEFSRAHRHGRPCSLILIDIDHFKKVNDTEGHLAGDAVLQQLSSVVGKRLRQEDVLARVGGEEFAVLLPEDELEGAVALARDLCRKVREEQFGFLEVKISITISLGVAQLESEMSEPSQLVAVADRRLYEAKENGRDQVR